MSCLWEKLPISNSRVPSTSFSKFTPNFIIFQWYLVCFEILYQLLVHFNLGGRIEGYPEPNRHDVRKNRTIGLGTEDRSHKMPRIF